MKIRLDFVTNSSSSSYVYIGLKEDKAYEVQAGKRDRFDALKSICLNDEEVNEDIAIVAKLEEYFFAISEKPREEFNYLAEEVETCELHSAYIKLLKDQVGLDIGLDNLVITQSDMCWGENSHWFTEDYGIICDHSRDDRMFFDKDGKRYYDYQYHLYFIEVLPHILKDEAMIQKCISKYKADHGESSPGFEQLVSAYIKALSQNQVNQDEIYRILQKFTTPMFIAAVLDQSEREPEIEDPF